MESYFDIRNRNSLETLSKKLEGLPVFCEDFIIGIEQKTSALTRLGYVSDLEIFFDFLIKKVPYFKAKKIVEISETDLDRITARDFERFLSYLNYFSYNGVNHKNGERAKSRKFSAVRAFFKYLYARDLIKENVTMKVETPKIHEKSIIRLDSDEVNGLLSEAEAENKFESGFKDSYNLNTRDRDIAILTLLLGTGIRVSELVGLDIEDISLERKSFVVTRKGGASTILYFNDEVKDALDNYLHTRAERLKKRNIREESALFLSLQDKRITVRAVENLVKKYARLASPLKKISPHKLRSTFGTALYRSTKDIYAVAEVLGHKDVNTTKKHYAAISEDIKKAAAEKVVLRNENKNKNEE
jgi:Site-specific recombinase XerD